MNGQVAGQDVASVRVVVMGPVLPLPERAVIVRE